MNKNGKKRIFLCMVIVLITIIVAIGVYYNKVIKNPLNLNNEKITIEVSEGEGFNSLLEKLNNEGLIKNKLFIKLNVKLTNKDLTLIPGTYEIDKNITLDELIKTLQTEDLTKNQISITIPEGYNIDEMAVLFEEKGIFDKDEFINAVKSYPLPHYVKSDSRKKYNLEGYLYPDTYYFKNDVTPDEAIAIMNSEFDKILKEVSKEIGTEIKEADIERIINIASLIEEEAQVDDERKLVSSVIENRLNRNMKLEFCSTINYAWGEHIENLRNRHLEIESPFNTYKYPGLPVGPICNPGKESIIAAINPAKTDYLYFMLLYNQSGKHHFSATGEEHERVKLEEEAKARANN